MPEVQHPLHTQAFPQNTTLVARLMLATQTGSTDTLWGLLTSFLAIFGVVFLNLEVLKRFMLPSQVDFRAFRVFLSSWLRLGSGLRLQLTAQVCSAVSVRFAARNSPMGRGFPSPTQEDTLLGDVLPRMLKHALTRSFISPLLRLAFTAMFECFQIVRIEVYTSCSWGGYKEEQLHFKQSRFSWELLLLTHT